MRCAAWLAILAAFCLTANLMAAEPSAVTTQRPPNVVLIFTDDQGYGDVGCFGSTRVSTPHLDRLAQAGRKFTNFYVAQAVCSASRAALLTGCYPNRIGILGALGPRAEQGISDAETTLGELAKSRGYATAIYGKWHLGHHERFLPPRHGFDDYFGLPYSNDMWPRRPAAAKDYPPLPLIAGVKTIETNPDQRQLTKQYTDHAVKFIAANKDRSFLLYVPHSMPHVPLHVSAAFAGKSPAGMYGDVIAEIDDSVGRIVAALDEHKLAEKTLVIFTTDNGPWLSYGNHAGTAGPFREGKGTTMEGGVRVPCIMRWPGQVPAGTTCDELAATIDIFPTVAKLIGAELPRHKIDGLDVGPLLLGTAGAVTPHAWYAYYWGQELQALRMGPWKLHFPHMFRSLTGKPGQDGKPNGYSEAKIELSLYHLGEDIGEKHNVADKHPEVVQKLQAQADLVRVDLGDSLRKLRGSGQRSPGQWSPGK